MLTLLVPLVLGSHYFGSIRKDYKMRIIKDTAESLVDKYPHTHQISGVNPILYQIDIRVDPCRHAPLTGGLFQNCCRNTNKANCQDNPSINAGTDLLLGYFQNAHIVSCAGTEFQYDINCGTYIEIHKQTSSLIPFSESAQVLADVPLNQGDTVNGYLTTYIDTSSLCAGSYELWWVIRTKSGPYVQFIKSFQVLFPSCQQKTTINVDN